MYTLSLQRQFIARHFLFGGDWENEDQPHAHHYRVDVRLSGERLDRHGYMVDLCELEPVLDECVAQYRDRLLNDLPEFNGVNPSIENFARRFFDKLNQNLDAKNITAIEVRIWENDEAWASFRETVPCASG